jgi:hypothetical protein
MAKTRRRAIRPLCVGPGFEFPARSPNKIKYLACIFELDPGVQLGASKLKIISQHRALPDFLEFGALPMVARITKKGI